MQIIDTIDTFKKCRKGTISLELTMAISNFNIEIMRPHCQYSTALKCIKSRYQLGNFIRTLFIGGKGKL